MLRIDELKIFFLFIGDATTSNKKQPVAVHSESKSKRTVDGEANIDQEDDGQWLTQSTKQVCLKK